MHTITLNKIKDCGIICSDGKSVLVLGKYLWIFREDGSFVAHNKEVRRPSKAVFLPGNMALVDGNKDRTYYYISLETGKTVWSSSQKGKRMMCAPKFALSPNGTTVFDKFYDQNNVFHFDMINPSEHIHETYTVKDTLRTSRAFFCDENGVLNVLQSHIMTPEDPKYTEERRRIYGILRLPVIGSGPDPSWVRQWTDKPNAIARGCNGRYTLYEGLLVFDHETDRFVDLLENDDMPKPPRESAFEWHYDSERGYLTVAYIGLGLNVVIDCNERRRVAQYSRKYIDVGFMGCLVGNEFWTGTETGVVRLPFPHFDPLP